MVFALRVPRQGERRVQCLEWTHLLQLGTAHLTEGRMPAALQRGRPFPLARTTIFHWTRTTQFLGAREGREKITNNFLTLLTLFISTSVGWLQKKWNSKSFFMTTRSISPCYRKLSMWQKQTSTSLGILISPVTVKTAKGQSHISGMM